MIEVIYIKIAGKKRGKLKKLGFSYNRSTREWSKMVSSGKISEFIVDAEKFLGEQSCFAFYRSFISL